ASDRRADRGAMYAQLMLTAEGEDARKAITDFQTVDDAGQGAAFIALRPLTGRKHQLRVHCAAIGAPIAGDRKYGGPRAVIDGVAPKLHLFCRSMTFAHPKTGARTTLTARLTGHMRETWRFFGFDADAVVGWPEDLR
ncbi:MAG: pseudouridine synthase, partial [Pseudomonadota bacterium]